MGFCRNTCHVQAQRLQRRVGNLETVLLCRVTYFFFLSVFELQFSWKLFTPFCLLEVNLMYRYKLALRDENCPSVVGSQWCVRVCAHPGHLCADLLLLPCRLLACGFTGFRRNWLVPGIALAE